MGTGDVYTGVTQLWNLESIFYFKKMIIQNKQDADQSDIF